jgi:adenosylcobinamide-GDP ribazoletransferase
MIRKGGNRFSDKIMLKQVERAQAKTILRFSTMHEWLDDLKTATAFLTRLPMPHPQGAMPKNFVRAHRMFPVVGAMIGGAVGLLCLALRHIGVPDLAAAALALGASAMLTGALHEDGLADVADGFGGGRNSAAKLEIMRDSRLGTYGALILLVSFAAKLSALAVLPDSTVVQSLMAGHALGRGVLPAMSMGLPYARKDGLAANAGKPDAATAMTAAAFALGIALLSLSWSNALWAALMAGLSAIMMAWLARRQIGGQTGDVLGGAEQVAETAILVLLAARLGNPAT